MSDDTTPDVEGPAPGAALPGPGEHRVFQGRDASHEALREALLDVAEQGCREMWWCDVDFADWPIGERAVVEALGRWAYAHRRLTVIAADYSRIVERHPRWVQFRRQWSHVVECRSLETLEASRWQGLLLAPGVVTVRVLDGVGQRGSISRRRDDEVAAREWVDAITQQSSDAFPATTLGL